MILKSMLKFCEKAKMINVEFYGDNKYLSDGKMCAYVKDVAPEWESADFATMLELDQDKLERFELDDCDISEEPFQVSKMSECERLRYSVNCDGLSLQPFMLPDNKIFFVDMERIKVFKDISPKKYFYFPYQFEPSLYVAKDHFIVGAIQAEYINLDTMKYFTERLIKGVKTAAESNFLDAGGQMIITDM